MRLSLPIGYLISWILSLKELLDQAKITYHGVKLNAADWSDQSHAIAFSVESLSQTTYMHIMINAYFGTLEFEVPVLGSSGRIWRQWMDTGKASPADIYEWGKGPEFAESHISVEGRSIVILVS